MNTERIKNEVLTVIVGYGGELGRWGTGVLGRLKLKFKIKENLPPREMKALSNQEYVHEYP